VELLLEFITAVLSDQREVGMKFPGWNIKGRSVYALIGWACGMAVGLLLYFVWRPYEIFLIFPSFAGMGSALWYGEVTSKIPSVDELNAPITLFPKDPSTKNRTGL